MNRKMAILVEGSFDPLESKTANGAIFYLHDEVVAVIDSTKAGRTVNDVLGYGGDIPIVKNLAAALKLKPNSLLIGIAPIGGKLPGSWRNIIKDAIKHRLHIISGLHTYLGDDDELTALAKRYRVKIHDLRKPKIEHEVVAKCSWRTRRAKTILSVGSDCNIGKKTTALQVHKEFLKRGLKSDFIGTGQTGVLIRGRGVAVDSVISDYIAGAIEVEIDKSEAEGYNYIFVEGQGALTHAGYSGVTLGLIHGTMPDAMLLCHQPTRLHDDYGLPLPDLRKLIHLHEEVVNFFKPTKVIGIGILSFGLTDAEAMKVSEQIETETGLPAIDTMRFGGEKLASTLLAYFSE
jgi:uncharacterized NAD-dependent epimerase/dehydratase family protein